MPERLHNDLEGAAMRLYPELRELRAKVAAAGVTELRMSGTGSTLYLVSETERELVEAEKKVGFLERDGVRLLRTRSAEPRDTRDREGPTAREIPWPVGRRQGGEQWGAE